MQLVLASRVTHHVAVGDVQVGSRTLQHIIEGLGSAAHCPVVASQGHKHCFGDGFALAGALATDPIQGEGGTRLLRLLLATAQAQEGGPE